MPELKWPECEVHHSLLSIADVKNARSYASTPQRAFMSRCLVKHRDNCTFTSLIPHRDM